MVVVSRRGEGGYEPLPYAQTPDPGKRRGSLVFGSPSRPYTNDAGWASPVIKMLSPKKLSTSPSSFSTSFYPKSSRSERGEINHWLVKVIYAAAAVSWIATRMLSRDYPSVIATMENDALIIKAQMEHMLDDLEAVNTYVNKERQTLNQLKKTRGALDHEIRLITEVEKTTGSRIKPAPRSTNEQLIKGWLNHRTDSLLTKIYYLQRYLQASSRTTVLERFVVFASPARRLSPF